MSSKKNLFATLLFSMFVLVACEDGPMEEAGESMDNAAEEFGESMEDATDGS
jgi:hypothetical protein